MPTPTHIMTAEELNALGKQTGYTGPQFSSVGLPSSPGSALPQSTSQTSPSGNLVDFKKALDDVMNISRGGRNLASLAFMTGGTAANPIPSGTMAANDFGSMLSNINAASDKSAEDQFKLLLPTYKTDQVGGDLYQYQVDGSGRIIGDPVKILTGAKSDTEKGKDAAKSAQKKASTFLSDIADRDDDGYPIPADFRNAKAAWVADGEDGYEFDRIFSGYVNPKKAQDYGVNFQTKVSSNDEDDDNPF